MNPLITAAFLAVQDANVIVVDWRALASSSYNTAAAGVPNVGQHLGNFLVWLINTAGGNWNNVHLVGFSLGAHVVGNAGRTASNRCARITGKCNTYYNLNYEHFLNFPCNCFNYSLLKNRIQINKKISQIDR